MSSVQTYARCPLAWHRRYVEKVSPPKSPAMAFGSAVGRGLEALHRGEDADLALVKAHAEEGRVNGISVQPGADYGLRLLALYRALGLPFGVPEQRFELHLPDRLRVPVPIVGYLDVMTDQLVIEHKTSRATWTQTKCDAEYQAAVYGWAFRQLTGRRPDCVLYVVMSTRTPGILTFETSPTGDDLMLFEMAAAACWKGITAGAFEPCGKRTCDTCKPPADAPNAGAELVFGETMTPPPAGHGRGEG